MAGTDNLKAMINEMIADGQPETTIDSAIQQWKQQNQPGSFGGAPVAPADVTNQPTRYAPSSTEGIVKGIKAAVRAPGSFAAGAGEGVVNEAYDVARIPQTFGTGQTQTTPPVQEGGMAPSDVTAQGNVTRVPSAQIPWPAAKDTEAQQAGEATGRFVAKNAPLFAMGAPELAGLGKLAPIGRAAVAGAEQGGASATINQAEQSARTGQPVNFAAIPEETASGAAFGGVTSAGGGLASKLFTKSGEQTVAALLRPRQIGTKEGFDIKNVFKHNLVANDVPAMEKKTQEALDQLDNKLDDIRLSSISGGADPNGMRKTLTEMGVSQPTKQDMDRIASMMNVINTHPVDLNAVLAQTAKEFSGSLGKYKAVLDKPAINRELQNMTNTIREATGSTGQMPLTFAMKLKTDVGTKGSWVSSTEGKMGDPDADAKEQLYNQFYYKLRDAVNKVITDNKLSKTPIAEINKKYEEIIPISDVIRRRIGVSESNLPFGMSFTDMVLSLGAGGAELMHGGATPGTILAGLGGLAASRGLRMGRVGQAERAFGQAINPATPLGQQLGNIPTTGARQIYEDQTQNQVPNQAKGTLGIRASAMNGFNAPSFTPMDTTIEKPVTKPKKKRRR